MTKNSKRDPWKEEAEAPQSPEGFRAQDSEWYRSAQDLARQLQDRPAFRYEPDADPLYQSAKRELLDSGRRAMEDSLGRASALTGGYNSSYAQSLAQQADGSQLPKLSELLPELYDRAKAGFDAETDALYDALGQSLGLYDREYQQYLDQLDRAQNQANWQAQFDRAGAQWDSEQAWQREKWNESQAQKAGELAWEQQKWNDTQAQKAGELAWEQQKWSDTQARQAAELAWEQQRWAQELAWEQQKWAEEFGWDKSKWTQQFRQQLEELEQKAAQEAQSQSASDAAKERSYAYRMAMLALQQGLTVSDKLLQTAGIDKDYADKLRRYYAGRR